MVTVHKELYDRTIEGDEMAKLTPEEVYRPLPGVVADALGSAVVEYDAFTVAVLPPGEAEALVEVARAQGLLARTGAKRTIDLPYGSFSIDDLSDRQADWASTDVATKPVEGLFIVQFAYPLKSEWMEELAECGAKVIARQGRGTVLLRVGTADDITSCGTAPFLSWVGPYFSTDRATPELVAEASADSYWLWFGVGTTAVEVMAALPEGAEVLEAPEPNADDFRLVRVAVDAAGLESLVEQDSPLIKVEPEAEFVLSDEHQGQILAHNYEYDDVNDEYVITGDAYLTWLNNRGLRFGNNQQTVAVFDSGYDDGTPAPRTQGGPQAHPDMRFPGGIEEYNDSNVGQFSTVTPNPSVYHDPEGHGTMVAGIITGVDDSGGIHGTGVAPDARVFNVRTREMTPAPDCVRTFYLEHLHLRDGLDASRVEALIATNSWNQTTASYNTFSGYYDGWVRDATSTLVDQEDKPMTIVFSAGNNGPAFHTVLAPATAKNVIAVGSTDNIQPFEGQVVCNEEVYGAEENPVNPNLVSTFSGRGEEFGVYPTPGLHEVRIKPDLVAPGWRIFSTAPWDQTASDTYTCSNAVCAHLYSPNDGLHNYGRGTSYSAPAVAGAAALFMKWHLDNAPFARGAAVPSPSLVKAALIATADSLFDEELCNEYGCPPCVNLDCRPSPHYGWGRVNLDRLTNDVDRFYRNEYGGDEIATGQCRSFTRKVDDSNEDVFIVLAWSDDNGNPQGGLVNDLDLTVFGPGNPPPNPGVPAWYGNTFNENYFGWDNGYSKDLWQNLMGLQDDVNTVEAVFLPAGDWPAGTSLQINVCASEIMTIDPQDYSIYAYNVRHSQLP